MTTNTYIVVLNGGQPITDCDITDDYPTYVDSLKRQIQSCQQEGGCLHFKSEPGVTETLVVVPRDQCVTFTVLSESKFIQMRAEQQRNQPGPSHIVSPGGRN